MQMIYANTQQGETEYSKIENELYRSITKAHELYHFILLLPVALQRHAAKRIENGKSKLRPSKEELDPNMKFVNNKLVLQLANNNMLSDFSAKGGLSWYDEDDLLKSVYARFCNNDLYKEYMSTRVGTYEEDKAFIIRFMTKELPAYAFFFDGLEGINIYWNDEIEFVISMAIKTLKQFTEGNDQVELMPLFKDADDEDFVKTLLRKTLSTADDTFELIKTFSRNWDPDRVAAMDVLLIQLATAEMMSFKEIPIRVTLNEYIELSKYYSTNKSSIFINGLLEKIVRYMVEAKKLNPSQLQ
jgi:N utilization substance protein B